MEIHYLGPAGTFSEQAANWFADSLEPLVKVCVPYPSISDTLGSINATSVAVVPYYNLIDGLITETPDRILQEDFKILAGLRIPIRIAAGHTENVQEDAPVFSHPKALAQCSDYLSEHHPGRERVAVSSTAEGVERAFIENGIALASATALEKRGAVLLTRDATNNYLGRTNYTEFVAVHTIDNAATPWRLQSRHHRCLLACDPKDDRPGLLAGMLSQLAFFNLNLARIHARPARGVTPTEMDPQIFFLEIAGKIDAEHKDTLLKALSIGLSGSADSDPKLLGEYPLFDLTETQ